MLRRLSILVAWAASVPLFFAVGRVTNILIGIALVIVATAVAARAWAQTAG